MALRFRILGSSSSGNAALLQTDETRVLVDAGFSVRKLDEMLADAGESMSRIDAIFLTHEHSDHSSGLNGLSRYPDIKVFANRATAMAVSKWLKTPLSSWHLFETGSTFHFRDIEVSSFSIPHDAQDPVGFVFAHGHDDLFSPRRSLAWCTDLGYAPAHVRERIREADVLVLEANFCPKMLEADTRRPWSLKQRINGRHGHLSNEAARDLLASVASPRWRHVFFAHLSRECNTPALVESVCGPTLAALRCGFSIVAPGMGSAALEL